MKVLVLGSGGREHALAWRLKNETQVSEVFLHPGNAGTQAFGFRTLGDVSPSDPNALTAKIKALDIDLTVIGPEAYLAKGYADTFRAAGLKVVGPGTDGAQLEASKSFAKAFLQGAGIPTARYQEASSPEGVRAAIHQYPIVLKLDGLAAGKGVVVAQTEQDTESFIQRVWKDKEFGAGPHQVVVEQFLEGKELSYIGVCDGETFVPLSTSSDYKRLLEKDEGPNTGGMGAISPSPIATPVLEDRIQKEVVAPTLREMKKRGMAYRGALYFGIMVSPDGTPYVLEFNARFGDPETQALMLRLEAGFLDLLTHTAMGTLKHCAPLQWNPRTSVYIVLTAQGYPAQVRTGDPIRGVDPLPSGATLFFSGVSSSSGVLTTHGGRVLGVGCLGENGTEARNQALKAIESVQFEGRHFRKDIGK
jgi:phosphoribosylamine---glycine ligase